MDKKSINSIFVSCDKLLEWKEITENVQSPKQYKTNQLNVAYLRHTDYNDQAVHSCVLVRKLHEHVQYAKIYKTFRILCLS